MIRNYQPSGSSNADLTPIYNSLQTINALLYSLDSQTTLPQAMSSLQSDMSELETKVNNLTTIQEAVNDLSSDINDIQSRLDTITNITTSTSDVNINIFITDRTLTTNITDYNTYNNTSKTALYNTPNLVIFEPYVQLVTDYNYISTSNSQQYNIPNATLNFTDTTTPRSISHNTIGMVSGGLYTLNKCEIGTLTKFVGGCLDCTINEISADSIILSGGNIYSFDAKQGHILDATFNTFHASSCSLIDCSIKNGYASSCNFTNCTIAKLPGAYCLYESMTLNDTRGLQQCTINNCIMKMANIDDILCSSCLFNNITFTGSNTIQVCTFNGITNNGVCDIRNCTINDICELNNAGTIDNCIVSVMRIKPGIPSGYSFRGNRISTLSIPSYMTNSNLTVGNTISSFVTY